MERSTKLLLSVECFALLWVLVHWAHVVAQGQPNTPPLIIDMHLHALEVGGPALGVCSSNENTVWNGWDPRTPFTLEGSGLTCEGANFTAASTNEELMRRTLAALERYNVRAITSGRWNLELVHKWRTAAPDRIIPAANFSRPGRDPQGRPLYRPVAELRQLVAERKLAVFAEVAPQYDGTSPADPALEPYFALAEELEIPIGLHMGEGPVGGRNLEGFSAYRVRMGDPLLLEDVLVRHPKLRVYVMHYGSPFVDNMIAMLFSYPQVYVDVAQNDWGFPRKHFHAQLRRLVEAGFGKRILFGSDQILWPDTIGLAIETIEAADFLTEEQKRDIFCRNAARFLRLDEKSCDQ
jgi:predicted TIM-barrel fold metal-dependent hydrolase